MGTIQNEENTALCNDRNLLMLHRLKYKLQQFIEDICLWYKSRLFSGIIGGYNRGAKEKAHLFDLEIIDDFTNRH